MTSHHGATTGPTAKQDESTPSPTGLDVDAWSRPQPVSLTVGSRQVTGHALAERNGRDGRQILVCLDGDHLTWVAAQRVFPLTTPPAPAPDAQGSTDHS